LVVAELEFQDPNLLVFRETMECFQGLQQLILPAVVAVEMVVHLVQEDQVVQVAVVAVDNKLEICQVVLEILLRLVLLKVVMVVQVEVLALMKNQLVVVEQWL
tara:strand:- start:221 stop:529 length:309 start_codon:yes stop_codon:yes gene_type:complete